MTKTLLTFQNAKTSKGEDLGYLTGILYMAPATIVKGQNVCKFASKGCKAACLYSAGRGKFSNVQSARIRKAELWRDNKDMFFRILIKDIRRAIKTAHRKGLKLCIRLNGTSDIDFENYRCKGKNIFEIFPNVQFYDYTKNFTRLKALKGHWNNYHLTFSRSESKRNQLEAEKLLKQGVNVAMVFKNMPQLYSATQVIDGDMHDLRFLDKRNVVVGLTAKGDAKKDLTGFVIK
jgi:hypothetical protein